MKTEGREEHKKKMNKMEQKQSIFQIDLGSDNVQSINYALD